MSRDWLDDTRMSYATVAAGYGGYPMKVYVHRRQNDRMITWLADAGFTIETRTTLTSAESRLGGIILARRTIAVNGP